MILHGIMEDVLDCTIVSSIDVLVVWSSICHFRIDGDVLCRRIIEMGEEYYKLSCNIC